MSDEQNKTTIAWEYRLTQVSTISLGLANAAEDRANHFGLDGWELVSVAFNPVLNLMDVWFKRGIRSGGQDHA